MFVRTIRVQYEFDGKLALAPLAWLDNFAMRNFTNDPAFDDTLPIGDGELQIGSRVPLEKLQAAMEDWFRRKGYLKKEASLRLEERSR